MHDLIIIGSGAAGLSAGLYAGRYRLKTLILGGSFGGETALAGKIENYPGVKAIDGFDLMVLMKEQAMELGVEVRDDHVESISRESHCFSVKTNAGSFESASLIFALGAERRRLGLPHEKELTGKGVHYCITCDGPLYRGKAIALVGGGDASIKGINLAAEYVDKIYLIVRGKELNAEPINLDQMKKLGDKVEILFETSAETIVGGEKLEKITLSKEYNSSRDLIVDGLFVEIGAVPNVGLAQSLGVSLDRYGYVATDDMMRTNVDGVFAAGDIVNHFGKFKQDIVAAALGAVAATSAYEHSKIHGDLCEHHAAPPLSIKKIV
ncbi:FAD-dependent oxidoreductase [Candidatus Uhrbacteria bacterium]|nr:FAD-dependent oxidoreductase [Candidatus Uhrbacteria bacterium]